METATPSKCVHLLVANWELAPSDNQPPAILRLPCKGGQAISKLWVLGLPRANEPRCSLEDGSCLCLEWGIPRFLGQLEKKSQAPNFPFLFDAKALPYLKPKTKVSKRRMLNIMNDPMEKAVENSQHKEIN